MEANERWSKDIKTWHPYSDAEDPGVTSQVGQFKRSTYLQQTDHQRLRLCVNNIRRWPRWLGSSEPRPHCTAPFLSAAIDSAATRALGTGTCTKKRTCARKVRASVPSNCLLWLRSTTTYFAKWQHAEFYCASARQLLMIRCLCTIEALVNKARFAFD